MRYIRSHDDACGRADERCQLLAAWPLCRPSATWGQPRGPTVTPDTSLAHPDQCPTLPRPLTVHYPLPVSEPTHFMTIPQSQKSTWICPWFSTIKILFATKQESHKNKCPQLQTHPVFWWLVPSDLKLRVNTNFNLSVKRVVIYAIYIVFTYFPVYVKVCYGKQCTIV